jgi:transposase
MEHIAIDLGGKKSQVCVRSGDGEIVQECRIATRPEVIRRYLTGRAKSRVIVESGAEAFWVAEIARECGHEVRVVPSMLAPSLGVGRRGLKSDQRDARVLSETSCRVELPSVHIPTAESRRLHSRLGMRDVVVRSRTKLVNVLKGYLRTIGERAPTRQPQTLIKQVREKLGERSGELEGIFEVIEVLSRSIKGFDTELGQLARQSELTRRLQTVPGVGVVTSLRFIATVDEHSRFRNGAAVGSYVGLVPREHSSGESQRRGGITKAGSAPMRAVLVQAAWAALHSRRRHDPMLCWARQVARRRGKKIAAVALARKLSGILFALWRDGTSYDPVRGARSVSGEAPAPPRRQAPSKGPRRPLRLEDMTEA